jgi:hypothetical protein
MSALERKKVLALAQARNFDVIVDQRAKIASLSWSRSSRRSAMIRLETSSLQ